MLRLRCDQ